jgi:hypothetical protein
MGSHRLHGNSRRSEIVPLSDSTVRLLVRMKPELLAMVATMP